MSLMHAAISNRSSFSGASVILSVDQESKNLFLHPAKNNNPRGLEFQISTCITLENLSPMKQSQKTHEHNRHVLKQPNAA